MRLASWRWGQGQDSNLKPPGYNPGALPSRSPGV